MGSFNASKYLIIVATAGEEDVYFLGLTGAKSPDDCSVDEFKLSR